MTKILSSLGLRPPCGTASRPVVWVSRSQRERVSEREFRDRTTTQKDNEMQKYITPAPGRTPEQTKKKLGRPPINKRAMTPAERQQRYRDRIKQEAHEMLKQLKAAQNEQ